MLSVCLSSILMATVSYSAPSTYRSSLFLFIMPGNSHLVLIIFRLECLLRTGRLPGEGNAVGVVGPAMLGRYPSQALQNPCVHDCKSFVICVYETQKNPHLQKCSFLTVTCLESTLAKNRGGAERLFSTRRSVAQRSRCRAQPTFKGFGGGMSVSVRT